MVVSAWTAIVVEIGGSNVNCCIRYGVEPKLVFNHNRNEGVPNYKFVTHSAFAINSHNMLLVPDGPAYFLFHQPDKILNDIGQIINRLIKKCDKFLKRASELYPSIDYTNLEWVWEHTKKEDVVLRWPPLFRAKAPYDFSQIRIHASFSLRPRSLSVPTYFNFKKLCFEVQEGSSEITVFGVFQYMIVLSEAKLLNLTESPDADVALNIQEPPITGVGRFEEVARLFNLRGTVLL